MMATFQGDVQLTPFFVNNLTGTGLGNYIHSTHVVRAGQNGIDIEVSR